jgi:hypothetical protein
VSASAAAIPSRHERLMIARQRYRKKKQNNRRAHDFVWLFTVFGRPAGSLPSISHPPELPPEDT